MSFRQYGGINYAARNNIVKNNYSNANNLSVMTKVGQPSSYINFESDISGNTIYGPYDFIGDVSITGNLSVSKDALINGLTLGRGVSDLSSNTIFGYNALPNYTYSTNTGLNTAIGCKSLNTNTTGYYNTAIGGTSLQKNTTGYRNNAVGVGALGKNTTGFNNIAVGNDSLGNNKDSYNNTAFGTFALYNQIISGTTDASGNWSDNGDNIAIGGYALYWTNGEKPITITPNVKSGAWNTAVGLNALKFNTTGYYNTAVGLQAGVYFNSGLPNGGGPEKANKCTFLGAESRCSDTLNELSQSTAIGYNSVIDASNQIMMGTNKETVKIPGGLQYSSAFLTTTNNLVLPLKQIYMVNSFSGSIIITLPAMTVVNSGITITFRRYYTGLNDITINAGTGSGNYIYDYNQTTSNALVTSIIMTPTVYTYTLVFYNPSWWVIGRVT